MVQQHAQLGGTWIATLVAVLLLAVLTPSVHAGAPNSVVYQGKVTTAAGGAISDTSLNMQFKIFDAASAGNCKWSNNSSTCATNANMSVSISSGLFTVYLGSDTVATIPDDLFTDNETLYLEVIIAGDTLSPRKQIGSSAYALSSQSISGANNETIKNTTDDFITFQGVGGTTDRSLTLDLDETSGPLISSGNDLVRFDDHVAPGTDATYTLGTSSFGWSELYLTPASTGSTGVTITGTNVTTGYGINATLSALTSGVGFNLIRANNATDFSNTTTGFLNIDLQDTASTGTVARFKNAGTGTAGIFESTSTSNNKGLEVLWNGAEVKAGNSSAFRIFADNPNLANSGTDASTRRDALVQIETDSESTDTFNYIAINSDLDGTPDAEWRVDSTGATSADGAYSSSGADYAEYFASDDLSLSAGEVVSLNPETGRIARSSVASDPFLFGVISTNPSFIGNNFTGAERAVPEEHPEYKLVALIGQVPVRVTDENGPVTVGDFLTSSSVPGHAMRAAGPGLVLGQALESFAGPGTGTIRVFLQRGWNMNGDFLSLTGESLHMDRSLVLPSLPTSQLSDHLLSSPALSIIGKQSETAPAVSIGMTTLVLEDQSYRLAFSDTEGRELAAIASNGVFSVSGDLVVAGALRLFSPAGGDSRMIYYDAEGAGWGSRIRTDATGWQTNGSGFAEVFSSETVLTPRDAVVVGTAQASITPADAKVSRMFVGIVSADAGYVAGAYGANRYPVVVSGRAEARISLTADVQIGDPLTAAETPGILTKAIGAGYIVGYALDHATGVGAGEAIIPILVQPGWYPGEDQLAVDSLGLLGDRVAGGINYSSLTLEGPLYLQSNDIVNVRSVEGASRAWEIAEDGSFETHATYAVTIRGHDDEDVATSSVLSLGEKVTLSGTGQLSNGMTIVSFEEIEPDFNDITSTIVPIKVLVTLTDAANGIYVTQKTQNGFVVQETQGGTSNASFDWYVEAYRKDHEPKALLDLSTLEKPVVLQEEVPAELSEEVSPTPPVPEPLPEVVSVPVQVVEEPAPPPVVPEESALAPSSEPVVSEPVATDAAAASTEEPAL